MKNIVNIVKYIFLGAKNLKNFIKLIGKNKFVLANIKINTKNNIKR